MDAATDLCPVYSPFFASMGCALAMSLCGIGAGYGTAKSSIGISSVGVLRPDLIIRCSIPVVMAGIVGIYGLVISVLIAYELKQFMPLYSAMVCLGAGICVGLSGLSAGFAIGIAGDAGVRGVGQQARLYVGMMLILIFAEVLGLYGLIVSLIMITKSRTARC